MAEKPVEADDPMELVGVGVPAEGPETFAECVVAEFVGSGLDDEGILRLFREPFYTATHRIYRARGEAYVTELIQRVRARWVRVV